MSRSGRRPSTYSYCVLVLRRWSGFAVPLGSETLDLLVLRARVAQMVRLRRPARVGDPRPTRIACSCCADGPASPSRSGRRPSTYSYCVLVLRRWSGFAVPLGSETLDLLVLRARIAQMVRLRRPARVGDPRPTRIACSYCADGPASPSRSGRRPSTFPYCVDGPASPSRSGKNPSTCALCAFSWWDMCAFVA